MNKVGIQSAPLITTEDYEEGIKLIKEAGFDCIDFNIDERGDVRAVINGQKDEYFSKSGEQLIEEHKNMKKALDEAGITVSQIHGPFPVYIDGNEEATKFLIDATIKCFRVSEFLGSPYVIVHPSSLPHDKKREKEANMEMYKTLIPYAKKYNVKICLENMFYVNDGHIYEACCSDIREACEYIDELNEIAGEELFSFCYDLGHANLLGKPIRESLQMLGKRLTTLHIHDNDGVLDLHRQPYAFSHYNGYITDWNGFVNGLKDIGYDGALSFETFNSIPYLPLKMRPVMLQFIAGTGKYFASELAE